MAEPSQTLHDEPAAPPKGGGVALAFLFGVVALDMLAIGLIVPVIPAMIADMTGLAPADTGLYTGALASLYGLMQFVFAPVMGGLSDRYGRRPVLLFCIAGFALDYFAMALAPTVALLFLTRAISGVFGSTVPVVYAYLADVTAPEDRARRFGLISAAFGLGFIIGPGVGGLLGELHPRAPFLAAGCLALANLALGWWALKESLPPERRRRFDIKRANPFGSLRSLAAMPAVLGLVAVVGIHQFAHYVFPATWSLYAIAKFGWSEAAIGGSLMLVGLSMTFFQAFLVGPITKALGEWRGAMLGFCASALGLVLYGLAPYGWMVYPIIILAMPAGLIMPCLQSLMTQRVGPDAQGELQGGVQSVNALAHIAAPLFMTGLFHTMTRPDAPIYLPGASFLTASVLSLLALTLLTLLAVRRRAGAAAGGR